MLSSVSKDHAAVSLPESERTRRRPMAQQSGGEPSAGAGAGEESAACPQAPPGSLVQPAEQSPFCPLKQQGLPRRAQQRDDILGRPTHVGDRLGRIAPTLIRDMEGAMTYAAGTPWRRIAEAMARSTPFLLCLGIRPSFDRGTSRGPSNRSVPPGVSVHSIPGGQFISSRSHAGGSGRGSLNSVQ